MGGQIDSNQLRIDVTRWALALVNSIGFTIIVSRIRWPKCTKNLLPTLSRYSIGIYCLSIIFQTVVYKINNNLFNISIPHNYFTPVLYAIITTIVCERILHYAQKNEIARQLFLGGR